MASFISVTGAYYTGDRINVQDVEVPQRPNVLYMWDGNTWVINPIAQLLKDRKDIDINEIAMLKLNNQLMTFVNMTPAQIDAWIAANVLTLADARNALSILAKIVNVAIRGLVRNGG